MVVTRSYLPGLLLIAFAVLAPLPARAEIFGLKTCPGVHDRAAAHHRVLEHAVDVQHEHVHYDELQQHDVDHCTRLHDDDVDPADEHVVHDVAIHDHHDDDDLLDDVDDGTRPRDAAPRAEAARQAA